MKHGMLVGVVRDDEDNTALIRLDLPGVGCLDLSVSAAENIAKLILICCDSVRNSSFSKDEENEH